MDLPDNIVHCRLRGAVRRCLQRYLIRLSNTGYRATQHNELRLSILGCFQQRPDSLKQNHDSHRVDAEMVLQFRDGHLSRWAVVICDPGICYDEVEALDAVLGLEF